MSLIKQNEPLKNYCTYGIGGPARVLLAAKNTDEIAAGLEMARKDKLPFFILGGGSNLLFSDAGFDGLVIKIENNFIDIIEKKENGARILAGAGTPLAALVNFAGDNSLSGMEWAAGIPGTFGGAIRGNAGAFGHDTGEAVLRVEALEVSLEKIIKKTINKKDCEFSYRNSVFKKTKIWLLPPPKFFCKKGIAPRLPPRWMSLRQKKDLPSRLIILPPDPFSPTVKIFSPPRLLKIADLKAKYTAALKFQKSTPTSLLIWAMPNQAIFWH